MFYVFIFWSPSVRLDHESDQNAAITTTEIAGISTNIIDTPATVATAAGSNRPRR
jgi:hypothetical protein